MTQRDWQKDFEGARESLIAAVDRADAAEIREQQLIEAAQKVVDHTEPITYLSEMLSTIYPDTPAPTPTLDDTKFLKTINEVWGFIKGDGSFTGPQLKEWSNGLDADLCKQILRVLIQTIWTDYGGKAVQEDATAPTPETNARPIDEWHEDLGNVLWWTFPIEEPPYCGSPLDMDWPDYHTHWTPFVIPANPAPKE